MRYILVMSLAGSLLQLFYYLTNNKKIRCFSYRQQDVLTKGILFFYLVPLVFLESSYRSFLRDMSLPFLQNTTGIYEYPFFYIELDGERMYNNAYRIQLGVAAVWFMVAVTVLCYRIVRYLKKRNRLLSVVQPVTEGAAYELLERVRRKHRIKRKIRLYHMPEAAITMGVFRPVICCNCDETKECLEMVLQHECAHIRRLDTLTRQLLCLVQIVHWFNPLVYGLPKITERLFEICCDEAVVRDADKNKRKSYATMLVSQSVRNATGVPVFSYALSDNAKELEDRIRVMLNQKTRTKLQTLLAVILMSVAIFMDSWTVLAYPEVGAIEVDSFEDIHLDADVFFVEDGAPDPLESVEYAVVYEKQFVDEDGNIYPIQEGISTAAGCIFHNWISGQVQEHVGKAERGCSIYIYNVKKCTECDEIETEALSNTTTYLPCPH